MPADPETLRRNSGEYSEKIITTKVTRNLPYAIDSKQIKFPTKAQTALFCALIVASISGVESVSRKSLSSKSNPDGFFPPIGNSPKIIEAGSIYNKDSQDTRKIIRKKEKTKPDKLTSELRKLQYSLEILFINKKFDQIFFEFSAAIKDGNVEHVKTFIDAYKENKFDINWVNNHDKLSILHKASDPGNLEMVKMLLDAGADVNILDEKALTPLHIASLNGNDGIATKLIDAGAKVNIFNTNGLSPLHFACNSGNADIVEKLLMAKAEVDGTHISSGLLTPLHYACIFGYFDIIKILLKAGANPIADSLSKKTPLDIILSKESEFPQSGEIIQTLIEESKKICFDIYFKDIEKHIEKNNLIEIEKKFSSAITNKNFDLVRGFLDLFKEKKFNINSISLKYKSSYLHVACASGNVDFVKSLLELGADSNKLDALGLSPLHYACISGNFDVVENLLNAGANPIVLSKIKLTPLDISNSKGYKKISEILIENGAMTSEEIDKDILFDNFLIFLNVATFYAIMSGKKMQDFLSSFKKTYLEVKEDQKLFEEVSKVSINKYLRNLSIFFNANDPLKWITKKDELMLELDKQPNRLKIKIEDLFVKFFKDCSVIEKNEKTIIRLKSEFLEDSNLNINKFKDKLNELMDEGDTEFEGSTNFSKFKKLFHKLMKETNEEFEANYGVFFGSKKSHEELLYQIESIDILDQKDEKLHMEYNKMAMLFYFGFVDMSEISKIFEENYKFSVNHEILHDFYLKKILEHNKETKLEDAIYRDLRIGFRVFNNEKYVLITSKKNIDTAILILPKKDKETEFFSAEIDDKFNIVKIIRELEIKNGKQLFEHLEEIKHFQQFKRIQETSGFLNSAMASRIEEKPPKVKSD